MRSPFREIIKFGNFPLKDQQLHIDGEQAFQGFRAAYVTVLLIDVSIEVKMDITSQDDFLMKFRFVFVHFKDPISKYMTLFMIGRV